MKSLLRSLVEAVALCAALVAVSPVSAAGGIRLQPLPAHVHKTPDAGNERTESWTFWLFVETTTPRELDIRGAEIQLLANGKRVRTTVYDAAGVAALTIVPPLAPRRMDGSESPTPIFWPRGIRLRTTETQAAKVDAMRITLTLAEGANTVMAELVLPVETYTQKTALIAPFQGHGIVTNAGVTNGGHRNRSGQFAVDLVGLDARYAVYVAGDGSASTDYAGWGRTLVAPAAGVVVTARADRPDQPDPETSNPQFFAPGYPNGGDPGNHVVIDHGNGEFSLLAHLQEGSVQVKPGDRVEQGQPLGTLGSSGDTTTPHVHYQLQSGPDVVWSDGLPFTFGNLDQSLLVRGAYFEAKETADAPSVP
jgi:hypothetical protein